MPPLYRGMAKLADARDLKSLGVNPCRFESGYPDHYCGFGVVVA